jgi:undecaprenyl-diphosphatase
VLLPAWLGGDWQHLVTESATDTSEHSSYLAFIVALHVATAVALLIFFRNDWVRIVTGFLRTVRPSVAARRLVVRDPDERLAWLIIIATIPVGITGLALEHSLRTLFAKPLAAAVFLTVNGVILLAGERLRRLAPVDADKDAAVLTVVPTTTPDAARAGIEKTRRTRRLATLHYREAGIIGLFQTFALLAGISRSGIAMVGGLLRGLSHRDAARFSFLLATPVILAAGLLKLPTLAGPAGAHIHGQVLAGAVVAGLASYVAVRWLTRYFETRTLTPFALYCLLAGIASIIHFA